MWENQQEPDWLASLRRQQGQPPRAEDAWGQIDQADEGEDLREQDPGDEVTSLREPIRRADVMEDLREHMIQAEEELEYEERPRMPLFLPNLRPWQRFILAVLLFMNVALCGCMALIVTGRVMPPF